MGSFEEDPRLKEKTPRFPLGGSFKGGRYRAILGSIRGSRSVVIIPSVSRILGLGSGVHRQGIRVPIMGSLGLLLG